MTSPNSAAVATPPTPSLRSTLAWTAASLGVTLIFVLLTPRLGLVCGVLLAIAALVAWSLRRPELLVIGAVAAAMLGNFGKVLSAGGASVTVYQAVFVSALLAYGWLVLKGRERLPRATPVNLWLGISLLLLLAGAFAALPAAQSLAGAVAAFLALGSSVLLVFLVVGVCSTPARLRAALVAFVLLAALFGAFAVLERFQIFSFQPYYKTVVDGIRARTTFKDPNIFGGVLAAGAAVGIPLAAAERRRLHAVLLWGAVALALAGVVATLSRGALLGFLIGAVVAVVAAPMRPLLRLSLVVLGLAGLAALFVVVLDPSWVTAKITGITSNSSALYRIYLAESAARMFQARPFGVGPGNWENAILAYRDTRVPAALLSSHTTYLTVLVETGILGLIGIVAGLAIYLWVTVKAVARALSVQVRTLAAASLAGGAVLLVQSLTYSLETSKFLWFMVGAGVAAAALSRSKEDEEAL